MYDDMLRACICITVAPGITHPEAIGQSTMAHLLQGVTHHVVCHLDKAFEAAQLCSSGCPEGVFELLAAILVLLRQAVLGGSMHCSVAQVCMLCIYFLQSRQSSSVNGDAEHELENWHWQCFTACCSSHHIIEVVLLFATRLDLLPSEACEVCFLAAA